MLAVGNFLAFYWSSFLLFSGYTYFGCILAKFSKTKSKAAFMLSGPELMADTRTECLSCSLTWESDAITWLNKLKKKYVDV